MSQHINLKCLSIFQKVLFIRKMNITIKVFSNNRDCQNLFDVPERFYNRDELMSLRNQDCSVPFTINLSI